MRRWARHVGRAPGALAVLATLACSDPSGSLSAQTAPDDARAAAETITAADLRLRVGALADDSMRGRDTPSPELEKAARHIGGRFEEFGLRPGNGGSFLQTYPLAFTGPGDPSRQMLRIAGPGGGTIPATSFVALPGGGDLTGEGDVVVTTLTDARDLSGHVALVRVSENGLREALGGLRALLDRGAAGVLFAVDASSQYFGGLRGFFGRERLSVGVPEELSAPGMLVTVEALPPGLASALDTPGGGAAYRATLRTTARIREAQGLNTIGWIEGSDPQLRDEYVIFSAHMDHLGVGRPVAGDSIYNGADDDASGTATVIELAEAFASLPAPPRRSVVFLTVSGEEKGLLGSRWYSEHPVFPLESTVADLNIDMIGRNWRDTVVAIGRDESSLGTTLEEVVAGHPELDLTMIDDPWPQENFYMRSDHYNFARNGVPVLFFFTGTHEDYHGPNDEPDRLLYEKMSRIARLIFFLGLEVADAEARPQWDPVAYRRVVEGGRE